LAAREMAAGQFKEIEPEHFCMALLKFAELPVAAFVAADEDPEIAEVVAADAELVREALQKCGIESTGARRKLRSRFGKGGIPRRDGNIHRSDASRALFGAAAALVAESGAETLTPLHLLTALIQSPTPAIAAAVLGKVLPTQSPAALQLLEKHGKDLVNEASEGRLPADLTAEVSIKAVLQVLLQKERKNILLLTDEHALAEGVAVAIACTMAGKEPPAALIGRRLIDIAVSSPISGTGDSGIGASAATSCGSGISHGNRPACACGRGRVQFHK
jgi:ATP-dependent Clp protease ATP-binding subunit ClpA